MNVDLVRELYKAGCTVNQIALRMSVPVHKVEAVVKDQIAKAEPPEAQPEPVAKPAVQSTADKIMAKAVANAKAAAKPD